MAEVFISYSEKDSYFADWLLKSCQNFNIDAFLASISLRAGDNWKQEILNNLRNSQWFFFLATENSIKSDAVKHEIGGALVLNKNIIPVLYGIEYADLPDWIKDYQGIKVDHSDAEELKEALERISEKIQADKMMTTLLAGVFIGALLFALKEG